ncbi:MAG: transglutaminase domain-containing protein [Desulfobulbaceae bacterium]|nr:MAG: transglutaminase domain-containing protein [Desulfobulbaceae bacterium]
MTERHDRPGFPLIKIGLFILWMTLFSMLLGRDYFIETIDTREAAALERAERTVFQGIYFKDNKIGYVENQFLPEGEQIVLRQKAHMQLNISAQTHVIDLDMEATLDSGNRLQTFTFTFSSPFYRMAAAGQVDGNTVSYTLETGSSTIQDSMVLAKPPLLATTRRAYLLIQGIESGEKRRIPWFDPISLTAKESILEYRGKEQVLIHGRIFNLHRFNENFSGARVSSWLDDEGNVVKEESPAGFVFLKEPEFKAKQIDSESTELLSSVAVQIVGEMIDLGSTTVAHYRLSLPDDHQFILNHGRQQFTDGLLIVTLETIPETSTDEQVPLGFEKYLAATPYIQADAENIIAKSTELTSGATTSLEKVKMLADWVHNALEKRPVIGIPDAVTTLNNLRGDCNEHASLFAALSRAAGVPTQIAVGVVYHKEAFYYHAWNEVYLAGQWVSLDTTTNQFPADLSHLRFTGGGLQEQALIGSLLGSLKIEPLPNKQ